MYKLDLVIYFLNIPQILMAFGIIFLKDDNDHLQELSKLEYELKISIFQRYRTDERDKLSESQRSGTVQSLDDSAMQSYRSSSLYNKISLEHKNSSILTE